MELLSVENVTFRYPRTSSDALRGVSLSVDDGQMAVLCGLSGCGKSTLLRLIKREIAPFGDLRGTIRFAGKDTRAKKMGDRSTSDDSRSASDAAFSDREAATGIGIVMQDPESQIVTDEVWHELAFGLENVGLAPEVIRRRVAEMASFFGIEDWYHCKTYELSGGQKQLLNLASALVMNPRLLLLDEPTAQLDPIAAADFRSVVTRVNRELGVTILMAEHRLEDVLPYADRVFFMDAGAVRFTGSPQEAAEHLYAAAHPMTEALPAATRVYFAITGGPAARGEATPAGATAIPFTVRDGRTWLEARVAGRTTGQGLKDNENSVAAHGLTSDTVVPASDTAKRADRKSDDSVVAIEADRLAFRYAKLAPDVLTDASLQVHAGEHYCLLGGNGSGKTTLLSLLAGLTKPYVGTVRLFGRKMTSFGPGELYRNNLALLPQQPRDVFTEKTIREDLTKAFERMENNSQSDMQTLCERLRITEILDHHPYDVSGGELQKAALAKVLASQPKVLLLDEPTKGIDVSGKSELAAILAELRAEGLAILTVTHDAEWAAMHADRCGLLFDGEVISEGTSGEFFAGNAYYTTAANRIARNIVPGVITCAELVRSVERLSTTSRIVSATKSTAADLATSEGPAL